MYAGLGVVVLGIVRLIWSKRSFLRSSSRIRGPISLPHGTPNSGNEALPFIRPDTPGGSRPSTPFDGSPSRHEQPNRAGLLYYLPVWVMPPAERSGGGGPTPNGQDANWSQYFSNLSFVDNPDQANRYHPIPSFSRPPSPSNNSILHAPGATHDGAFDGVQLHSIQQPQPTRPQNSVPTSSTSPLPPSTSGPNSPPAYSTLRSVGASLFRPFHSVTSKESGEIFHSEHPSTTFDEQQQQRGNLSESKLFSSESTAATSSGNRSSTSNLRPRSPNPNFSIPPEYTSSQPGSAHHSRSSTPTPQSSSTSQPSSQAEHGTEFGRSSQVEEAGREFEFESYDHSTGHDAAYDERLLGVPLEEEVDRLLNEMSPDSIDLEKGSTTARKA